MKRLLVLLTLLIPVTAGNAQDQECLHFSAAPIQRLCPVGSNFRDRGVFDQNGCLTRCAQASKKKPAPSCSAVGDESVPCGPGQVCCDAVLLEAYGQCADTHCGFCAESEAACFRKASDQCTPVTDPFDTCLPPRT